MCECVNVREYVNVCECVNVCVCECVCEYVDVGLWVGESVSVRLCGWTGEGEKGWYTFTNVCPNHVTYMLHGGLPFDSVTEFWSRDARTLPWREYLFYASEKSCILKV